MPHLTGKWTQPDGAVLVVRIGVGRAELRRLRRASHPIPQPKNSDRADRHTGAEVTCIDPSAVLGLGLARAGFTLTNLPAGSGLSATVQHFAALLIPHPSGNPRDDFVAPDHILTELPIGAFGCDVPIGRDILALCVLRFDGPALAFTLGY